MTGLPIHDVLVSQDQSFFGVLLDPLRQQERVQDYHTQAISIGAFFGQSQQTQSLGNQVA